MENEINTVETLVEELTEEEFTNLQELFSEDSFLKDKFFGKELGEINKDWTNVSVIREKLGTHREKFLVNLLKNPEIFESLCKEFGKKIVGEEKTCKVIFLCACGRLVQNSQIASYNLLVNSESGSGKDYVVSNVLDIIPSEDYVRRTRISPTAFTYWHNASFEPDWTWQGKVFYCEDISDGVLNSEVFKVMCSSGSYATVTIRQKAVDIKIEGKPVIITTTASGSPNPEMMRRFVLLSLDESPAQTKEIMRRLAQRSSAGNEQNYEADLIYCQRLLKRVKVTVPFSNLLLTYFPQTNIMMRTNFPRFLDFISASTAFHQFQREKDNTGAYIATKQDYEIARECFMKLFSNPSLIPVTKNQKEILEYFKRDTTLKLSVSELYARGVAFITERALETNLKTLARYGILKTEIQKDSLNRDITKYFSNSNFSLSSPLYLPTFDELLQNSASETSASSETQRDIEDIEDTEPLISEEELNISFEKI